MRELNLPQQNLDLRAVVVEASQALALLDADRLEELALACQALNQTRPSEDIPNSSNDQALASQALASQARRAAGDMKTFGKVLDATRANLVVMRRQRQLKEGKIEYSEAQARGWAPPEPGYGDN